MNRRPIALGGPGGGLSLWLLSLLPSFEDSLPADMSLTDESLLRTLLKPEGRMWVCTAAVPPAPPCRKGSFRSTPPALLHLCACRSRRRRDMRSKRRSGSYAAWSATRTGAGWQPAASAPRATSTAQRCFPKPVLTSTSLQSATLSCFSLVCSDLISSADTIIDIARSCCRLVDLTTGLQSGLGALAAGAADAGAVAGNASSATRGTVSSYDRLYALGSRIKYLIDTPETIYGCLDSREHLAAARRYVRASEVHAVLTAGQVKHVAQRFPLLQHQWPLVKKFRPQVYNAAGAWLASHGELTAGEAAATLAAQALLKPMDGAEVRHAQAGLGRCRCGSGGLAES